MSPSSSLKMRVSNTSAVRSRAERRANAGARGVDHPPARLAEAPCRWCGVAVSNLCSGTSPAVPRPVFRRYVGNLLPCRAMPSGDHINENMLQPNMMVSILDQGAHENCHRPRMRRFTL